MPEKSCQCCGSPFEPRPQVPNQTYCSKPDCQRDRRKRWSQQKLRNDSDYQDNLSRAQRAWHDRNPDYWREYRHRSPKPEPDTRGPQMQPQVLVPPPQSANIDASSYPPNIQPGFYWVEPIAQLSPKNIGTLIVKMTPACADCSCKKDACKYRT
jgi:hypothetical protein